MTRLPFALAVLWLTGCFASHASDQQELAGSDCYTCHTKDYAGTTAPVHGNTPQVFTTACASCHRVASWKPALEGQHSPVFIVSKGPHASIACLDCHDLATGLPSSRGANTNCIQCHPDSATQAADHEGATGPNGARYAYQASVPNFCLQCHPAGTADAHPDNLFARRGDHDVPCADCHDRSAGPDTKGGNVTCVESRCHHTLSVADRIDDHGAKYTSARGNGTNRNFCHQCHS